MKNSMKVVTIIFALSGTSVSAADWPWMRVWSEEVHQKAKEPKELYVSDGATHIDLYDRPQFVTPAVAKLTAFFSQHLVPVGGSV